jgi:hypothetical protein
MNKVAGELPAERMRFVAVPVIDEASDCGFELQRVLEAAVAQDSSVKDGEPDLDLVEPGGVQRRVDECEALAVPGIELAPPTDLPVMVDVEVVPDHDDALLRVAPREALHELHERGCVAMLDDPAEYLPRAHIERAEQGAGAVANVFEFMSHAPIGGDVCRKSAGKRLHGLFIDAQHHGAFRRSEVKLADTADFGPELRIWAV